MTSMEPRHRPKRPVWRVIAVVAIACGVAFAMPLAGYLLSYASSQAKIARNENPSSGYWRDVRTGTAGYTAVTGDEAGVLIQGGGQNWRALRNDVVRPVGGFLILGVVVAIAAFFAIRGSVKLEGARSGETILRWSVLERLMHWYTAILFVLLGITGLSLFFGRVLLIPVLGKAGFAGYANFAKIVHDYLGPFFLAGVIAMLLVWARNALFRAYDLEWLKRVGGYLGHGQHPHSGRFNGGQKIWYWTAIAIGLIVCASGYILDFPNFGQTRETMQLWNLVHGAFSLVFIALAFGHIYLGTLGNEGTFESMVSGKVDTTWAKQHHDLWYEEVAGKTKKS